MAVETKTIFLGTDWTLVSAVNTDGTRIVSTVLGYRPMILLADALPAAGTAGSVIGHDETIQTGKKLYACSPSDRLVQVQITRTVDSANPAIPELGDLTLSKSSWEAGQTPGSELATISGKTAGSSVSLERNDGDLAVSAQGDKLLAGLAPVGPGRYANALIERLAGSSRGSKRTPFEYAVPVPASASDKYMLASNRFGLPTDYGINDSGFASGDGSGRSGGNGASFAKYQYRSWGFSTTFEAKEGRFLWANVVNTVLGVRPNNFPVTIQRVDVRRWSDGVVVAQVKWGGSTSKVLAPAEAVWSDPMPTLGAYGFFMLDVYWVAAEHGAYPALPPMYQAGESGAESMTTDFSVAGRPTGSGAANAIGGSFGPVMFAARGWAGQVCPIMLGDSITDQSSVSAKLAAGRGDAGYLQQALGDVASGPMNWMTTARYSSNMLATMRDGYSSDSNPSDAKGVIDWIADACALLQPEPLFDALICAHGRNNLSTNQTLAGMQTLVEELAAKLRSRYPGMPLVQLATPPAVTVPASSYITPGVTQTPSGAANSAGGTIQRWRDWIVGNGGGTVENTSRAAPTFIGIDPWPDARDPSDFGKWVVDSWQATLLEAVTANSTNVIQLSDKPDVGDTLVFESGTSLFEAGARLFTVASVVPRQGGGYTVTGTGGARNSQADVTAPNVNGRLAKAHDVGAIVNRVASGDASGGNIVHPAHKYQQLAKTRIIPFKAAIRAAARAFMPTTRTDLTAPPTGTEFVTTNGSELVTSGGEPVYVKVS